MVPFLDVFVSKYNNNRIAFDMHRKSANTNRFMLTKSKHSCP